jgi:hypothetical protein
MNLAAELFLELPYRLGRSLDQALRIFFWLQHHLQIDSQRRVLVHDLLPSPISLRIRSLG